MALRRRKKPYFNSKEPSLIKSCCQSNCLISSRHKGEDPVGINISDRQMNAIITDPTCYRFLDLLQWHRDMRICHVGSSEVHCHLLVKWSLLDMLMGSRLLAWVKPEESTINNETIVIKEQVVRKHASVNDWKDDSMTGRMEYTSLVCVHVCMNYIHHPWALISLGWWQIGESWYGHFGGF